MNGGVSAGQAVGFLALCCIIVATFAPGWLATPNISQGLLLACPKVGSCLVIISFQPTYIIAIFALMCLATLCSLIGFIVLITGGVSSNSSLINHGGQTIIAAGFLALASVITFTAYTARFNSAFARSYYYSYGLCWAGAVLAMISGILATFGAKSM